VSIYANAYYLSTLVKNGILSIYYNVRTISSVLSILIKYQTSLEVEILLKLVAHILNNENAKAKNKNYIIYFVVIKKNIIRMDLIFN